MTLDGEIIELGRRVGKELCALGQHIMVYRGGSAGSQDGVPYYSRWTECSRPSCHYDESYTVDTFKKTMR